MKRQNYIRKRGTMKFIGQRIPIWNLKFIYKKHRRRKQLCQKINELKILEIITALQY
jgi:hypothetical protein